MGVYCPRNDLTWFYSSSSCMLIFNWSIKWTFVKTIVKFTFSNT
ncbi:hypothetical protein KSF78_0006909 [Schistosoma japonicum]|nr:hypothetical protein KSF78_0006909 [Schistosoma japonicum]